LIKELGGDFKLFDEVLISGMEEQEMTNKEVLIPNWRENYLLGLNIVHQR
jgi:hypothetical protein